MYRILQDQLINGSFVALPGCGRGPPPDKLFQLPEEQARKLLQNQKAMNQLSPAAGRAGGTSW